jgi:hypothetical protein
MGENLSRKRKHKMGYFAFSWECGICLRPPSPTGSWSPERTSAGTSRHSAIVRWLVGGPPEPSATAPQGRPTLGISSCSGHRRLPRAQSRPNANIGQVRNRLDSLCHAAQPQGDETSESWAARLLHMARSLRKLAERCYGALDSSVLSATQYRQIRSLIQAEAQPYRILRLIPNPTSTSLV